MSRYPSMDPTATDGRAPWRRDLLVVACVALLAACGGGDDVEVDDAADTGDDTEVEDTDPPDTQPEAAPDDDPAEDAEEPDEEEEPSSDGGVAEHRPPPEAEALVACDAVTESPPGAIIVFPGDDDPSWLEAGPGPVTVEVVGCSDTFEANLQYEAFHGQDTTPTLDGFTQGGTLGNWGEFRFEETYWTSGDWTVVVFENDAESGNRVEYDEVTFTVD